jgi:hypothetical protein
MRVEVARFVRKANGEHSCRGDKNAETILELLESFRTSSFEAFYAAVGVESDSRVSSIFDSGS